MKLAIVGSRTMGEEFYELLEKNVPNGVTTILSGGAKGADSLARRVAQERKIPLEEIQPNYKIFGKMAPIVRNREIVQKADLVLCLWDGASPGTRNVIALCMELNKPFQLLEPEL